MAAGTPVVASAIRGYEKVACAPATRRLGHPRRARRSSFRPATPCALAGAIAGLLADPARRAELEGLGRRRAAAFDMELLCDRYESVYRRVRG